MPQTKYASAITTKAGLRIATLAAAPAPSRSVVVGGVASATVSTLPAYQAAGSIARPRITNPATPTRQSQACASTWPSGAATMAPRDPAADTMPSTVLRTAAETGLAETAIVIAGPVAAIDAPIAMPAPI